MGNNEIWKPVKGYENRYEVSNLGRVRSLNYLGHAGVVMELNADKDRNGYLRVYLYKDGKRKHHLIHRLVWEAFCCEIPEWTRGKLQINHLDENKENNNILNLELCTVKKNANWGTRNERGAKSRIGKFVNHPSLSRPVNQIDKLTGKILNTYPSIAEAERQTGIHQTSISKCCKGHPRNPHAGGFKWKYVTD